MSWTDERVKILKKMWEEGQSASQIADKLGGVTRNAVIGKVHRLGLPRRSHRATPVPKPKPKPEPVKEVKTIVARAEPVECEPAVEPVPTPKAKPAHKAIIPADQPLPPQPSTNEISPEVLAKVNEVEKKAKKLTLMDLTERTCKWPIGDPDSDDFWFCGLPVQAGKPYCEAHVSVAFQPMSPRRYRRR
ncbi:MAG: GcrA cell cycle regulator [Rhodobacteraceae bacterium]|nr:GcrA cell cycle regulator [Paracoccaceae bacterium]